MCWDYSECGCCGERTYCIVYCDHNEEEKENGFCEHRDCKSFNTCDTCHQDLCDVCYAKYATNHCARNAKKILKYILVRNI